jgi:hypothetical protein
MSYPARNLGLRATEVQRAPNLTPLGRWTDSGLVAPTGSDPFWIGWPAFLPSGHFLVCGTGMEDDDGRTRAFDERARGAGHSSCGVCAGRDDLRHRRHLGFLAASVRTFGRAAREPAGVRFHIMGRWLPLERNGE